MTFVVRMGAPEDAEAIAGLIEHVDRLRFDRSEADWERICDRVREILASSATVTFVAERDGELVGELMAVQRPGDVARIGVSVDQGSRRQGVATALFAAVIEWAQEAGFCELDLDVQAINEPARALYDRLGFVDTGRHRRGERGPVLTLVRRLSA